MEKTIAALKRGLEAAAAAAFGFLALQWWNAGDQTLTGAIDIVKEQWDHAGGAALGALLIAFGYTRSKLPNLSPVAENQPTIPLPTDQDPGADGDDTTAEHGVGA